MQGTNANRINKEKNGEVEKPKMTKPVTGEFKKNRKKLGSMMKNKRQQQSSKGKQ